MCYSAIESHYAVLDMYTPGQQVSRPTSALPGHTGMQEANITCGTANSSLLQFCCQADSAILYNKCIRHMCMLQLTAAVPFTTRWRCSSER